VYEAEKKNQKKKNPNSSVILLRNLQKIQETMLEFTED